MYLSSHIYYIMETIIVKIALVGESGVGKTSIILRECNDTFRSNFIPSTSASYSIKEIYYDSYKKNIKFEIWDTLGQEKYKSMNRIFYKDVQAVILVFDITKKESFEQIKTYWYDEIKEKVRFNDLVIVLCGNKSDLYSLQEGNEEEIRSFAKEKRIIYKEVSAKNSNGIDDMFLYIGNKLLDPLYGDDDQIVMKKKNEEKIEDSNERKESLKEKKIRKPNPNLVERKYNSTILNKSFHGKESKNVKNCDC